MPDSSSQPTGLRLLREDAAGPISAVFAAAVDDDSGRRLVALKLLRELPEGGVDHLFDLRDRSRRIARLGHRHHACVTELALVDVRLALVSPYIDGIDLLDWMDVLTETGRVLPRRVACEILRCVAVALDVARTGMPGSGGPAPKLAHRDLKPTNVIISRDGEVKVTDFATGYTSLAGRSARSGALKKGLVRYLSPERRDGRRVTEQADVYALGILALELFRGRWLKRLRSQNPAHDRHLADVVARIEDLQMRSDSDERALRNLLLRMVAFDAEARPAVSEVAAAFREFADNAAGPSLESFAIAHAVPWLEEPVETADPRLQDVSAVLLKRGQPLPELSGEGLSVVTLPDRYDLQLAKSSGNETGDWTPEEMRAEVTDPRIRISGDHAPPADDIEDGFTESVGPELDEPGARRESPEAELWGDVTEPLVRGPNRHLSAAGSTPGRTTPLAQPTATPPARSRLPAPPPGPGTEEIVLDDDDLLGSGSPIAPTTDLSEVVTTLQGDPDTDEATDAMAPPAARAAQAPAPNPPTDEANPDRIGLGILLAIGIGLIALLGLASAVVAFFIWWQL